MVSYADNDSDNASLASSAVVLSLSKRNITPAIPAAAIKNPPRAVVDKPIDDAKEEKPCEISASVAFIMPNSCIPAVNILNSLEIFSKNLVQ